MRAGVRVAGLRHCPSSTPSAPCASPTRARRGVLSPVVQPLGGAGGDCRLLSLSLSPPLSPFPSPSPVDIFAHDRTERIHGPDGAPCQAHLECFGGGPVLVRVQPLEKHLSGQTLSWAHGQICRPELKWPT